MRIINTAKQNSVAYSAFRFMPKKPNSEEPYYPAELAHLEREKKCYRTKPNRTKCTCCTGTVQHQVYDPKRRMWFDHCAICRHTDRF